jgi:hypothetical protein
MQSNSNKYRIKFVKNLSKCLRFGPAQGARKILDREYEHAKASIESGIYVRHAQFL